MPEEVLTAWLSKDIEECEAALCQERRRRLQKELLRLVARFKVESSVIVEVCQDFLQPGRNPSRQVLGQLLRTALQAHCARVQLDFLPCIEETQKLVQQDPPKPEELGTSYAETASRSQELPLPRSPDLHSPVKRDFFVF